MSISLLTFSFNISHDMQHFSDILPLCTAEIRYLALMTVSCIPINFMQMLHEKFQRNHIVSSALSDTAETHARNQSCFRVSDWEGSVLLNFPASPHTQSIFYSRNTHGCQLMVTMNTLTKPRGLYYFQKNVFFSKGWYERLEFYL